jgi:hypothetical protein
MKVIVAAFDQLLATQDKIRSSAASARPAGATAECGAAPGKVSLIDIKAKRLDTCSSRYSAAGSHANRLTSGTLSGRTLRGLVFAIGCQRSVRIRRLPSFRAVRLWRRQRIGDIPLRGHRQRRHKPRSVPVMQRDGSLSNAPVASPSHNGSNANGTLPIAG